MTIVIISTIVVIGILYYFFVLRRGNLPFWRKAAKHPDFVYEQILRDGAWVIEDGATNIDKAGLDGPFLLYVPSIGRTVKFYGRVGVYEGSQDRIEKKLSESFSDF